MTLLNTADRIYLGSSQSSKVYLGSVQVFPRQFTDITSRLSIPPSPTSFDSVILDVPGWSANYSVDVTTATVGTAASGVGVLFAEPANPSVAATVTVRYVATTSRRIYHRMPQQASPDGFAWFEHVDGLTVEPTGTGTTTITYRWDVALQRVVVDSYTGSVLTRDHGPTGEATHLVPLCFSPELKTHSDFAQVKASHERVLDAVPAAHRQMWAQHNTIISIVEAQEPLQCIFNRHVFDGAYGSGSSGTAWSGADTAYLYADATTVFDSTGGTVESRVMLHELNHITSNFWQTHNGTPYGRIPWIDLPGEETIFYHSGTSTPQTIITSLPGSYGDDGTTLGRNIIGTRTFDTGGTLLTNTTTGASTDRTGKLEDEQEVYWLWKSVYDAGVYYLSQPDEFTAESFTLYHAQFIPGITQGTLDAMADNVGGWGVHEKFVDYMKSIGVIAGTPSNASNPGTVTGLTGTGEMDANYYNTIYTVPKVTLTWTKPTASDLASYTIRRATGTTAPATRNDGKLIPSYGPASEFSVDSQVVAGETYTYAIWARNFSGGYSTVATVTVTVPAS